MTPRRAVKCRRKNPPPEAGRGAGAQPFRLLRDPVERRHPGAQPAAGPGLDGVGRGALRAPLPGLAGSALGTGKAPEPPPRPNPNTRASAAAVSGKRAILMKYSSWPLRCRFGAGARANRRWPTQGPQLQIAKATRGSPGTRNCREESVPGFWRRAVKLNGKVPSICVKNTPMALVFRRFILEIASHLLQCGRWRR